MATIWEKLVSNDTNNSCSRSNAFSSLLRFVVHVFISFGLILLLMIAFDRLLDLRSGTKTLLVFTTLIEAFVLFDTANTIIPRFVVKKDNEEINSNNKQVNKLTIVFVEVLKTEMLTIVPFFMAYGVFNNADVLFAINCVVTVFSIGVLITAWSMLLYSAVNMVKKHIKNLTKTQEIVLFVVFLIVSIIGFLTSKGVSVSSLVVNIIEIFKQVVFGSQVFVITANSNFLICIDIIAILLVLLGLVWFVRTCSNTESEVCEVVKIKEEYSEYKDATKYENVILRSCLARSPTI